MKPPPFKYLAPASLEEALAALAQHGDEAKILAGGQSLVPVLNFRLARPSALIDINGISSLAGIQANGSLRIGAMTRQRVVERSPEAQRLAPLLAQALPHVAHPQIRNRGTIGGSLAHADPAAELPAVMLALDARFKLRRATEQRWVNATDFYTGLFSTALRYDEMLVEVEIPAPPPGTGSAFEEVARRHGDYALLAVAAVITRDDRGVCRQARLAYVNGGPGPLRATEAETLLTGQPLTPALLRAAAQQAVQALRPPSDVHASTEYRLQLGRVLTERALARAVT